MLTRAVMNNDEHIVLKNRKQAKFYQIIPNHKSCAKRKYLSMVGAKTKYEPFQRKQKINSMMIY